MIQRRVIFLLCAGHLVTDVCQGAVPALLPFFISEHHLSYAAAGFLVLAATISSSVIQPLFGYLADRISLPWFVALGPLLAGVGIAMTGLVHNYHLILMAVTLCGFGVAVFHPEAARIANQAAGEKKASGMSIFSVGGNAGFALGPVAVAVFVLGWGLKGTLFFLVPVLIVAPILFVRATRFSPALPREKASSGAPSSPTATQAAWGAFLLLTGAVILRSVIHQGFNTFLSLYWIDAFHKSKAVASTALTLLLGMGVIGNLVGGRMGDRFGYRRTIMASFFVLIPLLLVFVHVKNLTAATLLLLPIGFTIFVSFSPIIVMGQQCLPGRIGFASGVTIGLAVSVGGFAAPLLGRLADQSGIQAVFYLLAFFPILAAVLTYFLPKTLVSQITASDKG